jgi:hypothetical protein
VGAICGGNTRLTHPAGYVNPERDSRIRHDLQ